MSTISSGLKTFVEKQCHEIHTGPIWPKLVETTHRVQLETLRRDLQEASQHIETLKADKTKAESEASAYKNLAGKTESDLKSLSDAYNNLEQANFRLEKRSKSFEEWTHRGVEGRST